MNARMSAFGILLRQFREAAGMSQELLAERAGLSLRGVSDLERGVRTTPRLETVRMLAEGLGLDEPDRAALLAARNTSRGPAPAPSSRETLRFPTSTTTLFGRQGEIGTIATLLTEPHARLVTLVGPGGVGKTRLAVEVGHRLADAFPGGVIFAGLSSVKDPALVLPTIASAIGVPDTGSRDVLERLAVALQGRMVLLVLDNVEHVVDAAFDIAALLSMCPTLTILATSRVVLRVAAEQVVEVAPLALPESDVHQGVDVLANGDAVAMFVDRARAVAPDFSLTAENSEAVGALVTRLDGLPLAIELAAARIRLLPPDALLARMDQQLPLLTGGGRDVPERQQTMRNAIAWSHELLTGREQEIFRRLSIFRAGCTLEAAEKVLGACSDLDEMEILDGLNALVDSSLLQRRGQEENALRFVMLATVREFGVEQLAAHGEEEATREAAYRTWYRVLASKAEPSTAPDGMADWLELLENEHDNFRSAISWLVQHDRIRDALDLSGALWFFRWLRGHYAEARDQYEELLRHPLGSAPTVERARALIGLGVISLHQGDSERSREALNEAIEILRAGGEQRLLSMAHLCLGNTYLSTGQLDQAEQETRTCYSLAIPIGAKALEESALGIFSVVALSRGQASEARELLGQQVDVARSIGDTWGLSLGLRYLGIYSMQDGDLERAEEQVEEATQLMIALKDRRDLPLAYRTLADIARLRGDLEKATSLLAQAYRVARDMGDSMAIAQCVTGLAKLAHLRGDNTAAMSLIREAIRTYRELGDDLRAVGCLEVVSDIAVAEGDAAHAAWCIGAVDRVSEQHGFVRTNDTPGEHEARVERIIHALGEPGWRKHWTAGHGQDVDSALEIGLARGAAGRIDDASIDGEVLSLLERDA